MNETIIQNNIVHLIPRETVDTEIANAIALAIVNVIAALAKVQVRNAVILEAVEHLRMFNLYVNISNNSW
jgi:hypothetical protein